MASVLEQLSEITTVVADSGDIKAIQQFQPMDATTNPSLILKSTSLPEYAPLITEARIWANQQSATNKAQLFTDYLAVSIGCTLLESIPGRVSTEVDARLSFDTSATLKRARQLVALYQEKGIDKERILIKIASTWEGILAAKTLEQEGIQCNLTLLFSMSQAIACAEAKIFLISPFVGRILDWYKAKEKKEYSAHEDPGVLSVTKIYQYYKYFNHKTVVMGASFRSTEQVKALAGCDRLTVAPALLEELSNDQSALAIKLSADVLPETINRQEMSEKTFRWNMNSDAMATEKLAEGIRAFAADQIKLEALFHAK